jgi:hypothetical protein
MVTITTLSSITLDKLLARGNPFIKSECRFDLTDIRLITPGGLVAIAASCYALAQNGRHAIIAVPESPVRTYLARSGFVNTVSEIAAFDPPFNRLFPLSYEFRRGSNPMLLELTMISTGSALPSLLDKIIWALRHRLKYPKYDAFDIATAISETCQNTFDHNQRTCGFIAMQGYSGKSGRFIEIAIADYGDGLKATLSRNAKNPRIPSDFDAIRLATKLGVSQYDDPTRGTGLYHLLEIAYKHQGTVQFRSGSATLRYRMDKKQGWGLPAIRMPGLQVTLTLGSKTPS